MKFYWICRETFSPPPPPVESRREERRKDLDSGISFLASVICLLGLKGSLGGKWRTQHDGRRGRGEGEPIKREEQEEEEEEEEEEKP